MYVGRAGIPRIRDLEYIPPTHPDYLRILNIIPSMLTSHKLIMVACRNFPVRGLLGLASRLPVMDDACAAFSKARFYPGRCISGTPARATDGVFRGLVDNRLPMPWIEAWRLQQDGKNVASDEARSQERDLHTPKKMSDSYHRVVLPLGRDPWLSDTYINSSGHIRSLLGPFLLCCAMLLLCCALLSLTLHTIYLGWVP